MLRIPLLASILLLPTTAAADQPCARTISGVHVPAFVSSAGSELDLQTGCLLWESSAQPRAELIPPAGEPAPTRRARVRTILVAPHRASSLEEFLEPDPSFHLGASLQPDGPPIAAPRPSVRRP